MAKRKMTICEELLYENANLTTQNNQLQAELAKARTYTGLEGYPCPLCIYENGKFIEACVMHKQIKELQAEVEAAKREIGRLKEEVIAEHYAPEIVSPYTLLEKEKNQLQAEVEKYRWIPVSEIPQKIKGWVEFINFHKEHIDGIDGSIGGICKGTYSNIKYIQHNYTHWKPIILPEENNG